MTREHTVCFKVDTATAETMHGIPNRSDFLRSAVLAALRNTCPVCRGTGHLSPRQMSHWRTFAESHAFERCTDCEEYHWVCAATPDVCKPVAPLAGPAVARPRARRRTAASAAGGTTAARP
jgi:hypothetical protein